VNDLLHDVLEDDRPIPLGRAAFVEAESAAGSNRWALANDCPEPAEPTTRPTDADEEAPQDAHPLTGLRGFRLEPVVVERPYAGRHDLARFLIEFALVMAFVYALIVAFVLLLAHTRGTPL